MQGAHAVRRLHRFACCLRHIFPSCAFIIESYSSGSPGLAAPIFRPQRKRGDRFKATPLLGSTAKTSASENAHGPSYSNTWMNVCDAPLGYEKYHGSDRLQIALGSQTRIRQKPLRRTFFLRNSLGCPGMSRSRYQILQCALYLRARLPNYSTAKAREQNERRNGTMVPYG
jgi:hypothetical protein